MKIILYILALLLCASIVRAETNKDGTFGTMHFDTSQVLMFFPKSARKYEIEHLKSRYGWKYNDWEWLRMTNGVLPLGPKYYKDPKHGSNGGWDVT